VRDLEHLPLIARLRHITAPYGGFNVVKRLCKKHERPVEISMPALLVTTGPTSGLGHREGKILPTKQHLHTSTGQGA